jgi:large subunit ribosomal protein L3
MHSILGFKHSQTQKFLTDGTRIPVSVISVPDNIVTQIKTSEKDSYSALQIGIGTKKKPNKALVGHMKKANQNTAPLFLREIKMTPDADTLPQQGEFLQAKGVLEVGDIIKVTGTSKGKGFAGGVKRHGFKGGPRTHGQSDRERAPGSIGQTTTPGRVYKGKRMAGRMGTERVTVSNLVVVAIDDKAKQVFVKGLVPGYVGSLIVLEKTGKLNEDKIIPVHGLEIAEEVVETVTETEQTAAPSESPVETASVADEVPATAESASQVDTDEVVPADAAPAAEEVTTDSAAETVQDVPVVTDEQATKEEDTDGSK